MARVSVIPGSRDNISVSRIYYNLVKGRFNVWIDFNDPTDNASVLLEPETLEHLKDVLEEAIGKVKDFQKNSLDK